VNRRQFLAAAATAPLLLRDDPAAFGARLGGTPLALVTADRESQVVAVELGTGRVYRRIQTLPGPRSIETVGWTEGALIAHTSEGAVSIIDAGTLRVRHVLRGFAEPRYTANRLGSPWAYVSDSGREEVLVVDIRSGRIAGRTRVSGPARHLSLSPSGRVLWVALGSKAERVAILDVSSPARPRLLRTFSPPFRAHDVGFQPGSGRVWVTSGDEDSTAVYDARTGGLIRRLSVDSPPQHLTFARGAVFVTSGEDGTLRVQSLSTGEVRRTTRIPLGSYNVDEGWGVVFTPSLDRGTLCIVDRNGRIERSVRVASSSHDACFVASA
jgi:DNA-binding beta-propeller fold protein YncE